MFALVRSFLLSPSFLLQSIVLSSFGTICLHATRPVTLQSILSIFYLSLNGIIPGRNLIPSETGWRVLYRCRLIGNRLASVVSLPPHRKPASESCIATASLKTSQRGLYRCRGSKEKKKREWRITTWEAPRAGKALRIFYSRSWIKSRNNHWKSRP